MEEELGTPSSFESATDSPSISSIPSLPFTHEPRKSYTSSRSNASRPVGDSAGISVERSLSGLGFLDLGKEGNDGSTGKSNSSPPRIILGRRGVGRKGRKSSELELENKKLEEIDLRGPELIPIPSRKFSPRIQKIDYGGKRNYVVETLPTPPSSNPATSRLPTLQIPSIEIITPISSRLKDWLASHPSTHSDVTQNDEMESGYVKSPSLTRPHPKSMISGMRRARNRGISTSSLRLILVLLTTITFFLLFKSFNSSTLPRSTENATQFEFQVEKPIESSNRRRERILAGPTKIEKISRTSSNPFPRLFRDQFQLPAVNREMRSTEERISITPDSSTGEVFVNKFDGIEVDSMVERPTKISKLTRKEETRIPKLSFKERKLDNEKSSQRWKDWKWIPPTTTSQSSLILQLALLTVQELDWREWILEFRTTPLLERLHMRSFDGGSFEKHSELTADFLNLDKNACQSVTGLERYRVLHDDILDSKSQPKFLSSLNSEVSLSSQLIIELNTFHIALLSSRAYVLSSILPSIEIPLTKLFNSPNDVQWDFNEFDERYLHIKRSGGIGDGEGFVKIDGQSQVISELFNSPGIGKKREGVEQPKDLSSSTWVSISDSPSIYSTLTNSLNLKPQTATVCLFQYLFNPLPIYTDYASLYTSLLSLPTVFSIGIELNFSPATTFTLHKIESYLCCAIQLAKTYAITNQRIIYYITTNSPSILPEFQKVLGQSILMNNFDDGKKEEEERVKELIELEIFSKTDYQIIQTGSQFGKLMMLKNGRRGRTVSIGTEARSIDCRFDSAFINFSQL